MSLNKVMMMGNLTRDVELKYTPSGLAVARVGLAMNRKFRDTKTNELREEVTFVDVEFWGKQAETLHQYMSKGKSLFVEGRLKMDSWDDKTTGKKVSKLKVVGDQFQFMNAGPGAAAGGGGQGGGAPAQRTAPRPLPPRPAGGMPQQNAPMMSSQDYGGDMQDQGMPPDDLQINEDNVPF
ncbi:MAG: single-stranded DNA-binding protein [Planctomycetota bacterium]